MTTFARSVNFDERARTIVSVYMKENNVKSFSLAVREIINKYQDCTRDLERWRTIAYRTQGMTDEGKKV